ncbi:MAG: MFS transporter [Actinomycetota bacterium]|nr:MFS transporter [Actinomycetota bacterium]
MWNVVTASLRQTIVPNHLLGRVNASYRLLAWGTIPLGGALGGVVAEAFGLRAVFLGGGVLILCLLGFTLRAVTDATIDAALTRGGGDPVPIR